MQIHSANENNCRELCLGVLISSVYSTMKAPARALPSRRNSSWRAKKSNASTTKSAKESENETLDSIFQRGAVKSENFVGTATHTIGKVAESHLLLFMSIVVTLFKSPLPNDYIQQNLRLNWL